MARVDYRQNGNFYLFLFGLVKLIDALLINVENLYGVDDFVAFKCIFDEFSVPNLILIWIFKSGIIKNEYK